MSAPLDPRITFTRASTATYTDATGAIQTAAVNAPRWDYDPVTHALRGLLIEEARTNLVLNSGNASNVSWGSGNAQAPVTTPNQVAAPDGTLTATRAVYPVATGAGAWWNLVPATPGGGAAYAYSVWLRGLTGGERLYLNITQDAITYYRTQAVLTTAWQRFAVITPTLGPATTYFQLGTDLRDAGQTATPAQTVFIWGGQVEAGAFPTSYIPTASATVTRAADAASLPTNATWFNVNTLSLMAEYYYPAGITLGVAAGTGDAVVGNAFWLSGSAALRAGGGSPSNGIPTSGSVNRVCGTLTTTQIRACINGQAVAAAGQSVAAQVATGRLSIGTTPWALDNPLNGHVRRVQYWPRVLSDTEMQSVTS
jgi:hypothetical protein